MASRPRGLLDYSRLLWLRLWFLGILIFLYAPILVLIVYSFNDSKRNIVWRGFTTKYYVKAAQNDSLREALVNSIMVSFLATLISVILGTLLAIALWRFRFSFKPLIEGMYGLPIVIPEICLGVALLAFFARTGFPRDLIWPLNLSPIIIGHVVFSFPFVAMVVRARLSGMDRSLIEAAADLGASEWRTLVDVLIPSLKPAIIAGGLLAMTLSLDDFVITFFTSGPETVTLPVKIYSMVRFGASPEVNAASTVLIAITLVLTVLGVLSQRAAAGETS